MLHEPGCGALGALTQQPQAGQALAGRRLADELVGQADHLGRGPVVALELDHLGVAVAVGEAQQVLGVGAGEGVDGLVRVADHAHLGPATEPGVEQPLLQRVDVLVLVDDEVPVLGADLAGDVPVLLDGVGGDQQQVLEVQRPVAGLGLLVALVDRGHRSGVEGQVAAGGSSAGRVVVGGGQRRLGPLDLAGQVAQAGAVGGEPVAGGRAGDDPQLVLDELGHRAAEHPGREVAQLAHRRRVEGAGLHPADAQRRQPPAQLPRGARGEGHREHLLGHVLPQVDAVGDPVRDGAGLARPGAGEDAHRPPHRLRGGPLLLVQPGQDGVRSRRAPAARPRACHLGRPHGTILPAGSDGQGKHPQDGGVLAAAHPRCRRTPTRVSRPGDDEGGSTR